jgi:hypothetical protein
MHKFLILTILSVAANAQTTANLWVDANGGTCARSAVASAYNDGAACADMQAAQTAAQAGDTVRIKNGTYGAQALRTSGKTSAVNYFAETAGGVLVSGLTINIDKIHVTGVITSGTGESRGYLDIQDRTETEWTDVLIDGFQAKYAFVAASGVTVQNSEFGNASACNNPQTEDAFRFWAWGTSMNHTPRNVSLLRSRIHDWTGGPDGVCTGTAGAGIHPDAFQADGGDNMLIDGNLFYNNASSNIQQGVFGGPTLGSMIIQNNYFGPTQCCNNLSIGQAPCGGVVIRNNVIVGNENNGGGCTGGTPKHVGNIFTRAVSACSGASDSYNIFPASGGTTCGTNAKRCDVSWASGSLPSFGGAQPDPHLSSSDTCAIGAGNPTNYPPTDIDGQLRTGAPDAGADQRGSGSQGLQPPTSLYLTVK